MMPDITVFSESFPEVASFSLSTMTGNDPKKRQARSLLPSPSLDIIVQTFMDLPAYPNEPSATDVERRELWMLHAIKSKLAHATYGMLETLMFTREKQAGFSILVGGATFIISGALFGGGVASPYAAAVVACTSILSLAGSYMFHSSRKRLSRGVRSMDMGRHRLWYERLPKTLMRADMPIVPSILMEIARLLDAENPKCSESKWKLLNSLSVSDHLAMMRLATKLEGTKRFTSGKETVVALDGDTQETCHRVMETMDIRPDVCDDTGRITIKF